MNNDAVPVTDIVLVHNDRGLRPMTGKRKSMIDKLAGFVIESDDEQSAAPAAPPQGSMAASLISPMPQAPSMAPIVAAVSNPAQEPVDPEALATVKQQVYAQTVAGRASNFIFFLNMWEALGRPTDLTGVTKALQVTNPNMTPQAILADIDQHIMLLDGAAAHAKHAFDSMAAEKLGGNDTEITTLTEANQHAVREIERHNAEIAQRTQRLQALQTERAETEGKLTRARQRATDAEGVVRAELASFKQMLAR